MEVHEAILVRTVAGGASRWIWAVIGQIIAFTIDKGVREFNYSLLMASAYFNNSVTITCVKNIDNLSSYS